MISQAEVCGAGRAGERGGGLIPSEGSPWPHPRLSSHAPVANHLGNVLLLGVEILHTL